MGTIRAIRPDEVDELFAMICELADYEKSRHEVQSTAEDFRVALFGPNPQLFGLVVEHEGTLGGFAVWYVNFSTWSGKHGIYLEDLYVRPHLRGHGYGKALLAELARICVERGYPRLALWNGAPNRRSNPPNASYPAISLTRLRQATEPMDFETKLGPA